MKDLNQFVRKHVLRSISDDYENFDRILKDVSGWAAEREASVDHQTALKALDELISDGYAQAYCFSTVPPGGAEEVSYSADRLDDLWFYVTPRGKRRAHELAKEWS